MQFVQVFRWLLILQSGCHVVSISWIYPVHQEQQRKDQRFAILKRNIFENEPWKFVSNGRRDFIPITLRTPQKHNNRPKIAPRFFKTILSPFQKALTYVLNKLTNAQDKKKSNSVEKKLTTTVDEQKIVEMTSENMNTPGQDYVNTQTTITSNKMHWTAYKPPQKEIHLPTHEATISWPPKEDITETLQEEMAIPSYVESHRPQPDEAHGLPQIENHESANEKVHRQPHQENHWPSFEENHSPLQDEINGTSEEEWLRPLYIESHWPQLDEVYKPPHRTDHNHKPPLEENHRLPHKENQGLPEEQFLKPLHEENQWALRENHWYTYWPLEDEIIEMPEEEIVKKTSDEKTPHTACKDGNG